MSAGASMRPSPLERLIQRYRPTVLRYLAYKFAVSTHEAEDLWEAFVVGQILEKEFLSRADPHRGRFRSYLLRSLDRFVISQRRRAQARKRSPVGEMVPFDAVTDAEMPQVEAVEGPDSIWAQAVIAGALLNMYRDCQQSNCPAIWGVFEGRILSAILDDKPPMAYAELVRRFEFKSPTQAFNSLVTAKRMFRRNLERVIAEYAADDRGAEEELTDLRRLVKQFA